MPPHSTTLVIYNRFLELILKGLKTVELRATSPGKHENKWIYVCPSGACVKTSNGASAYYILGMIKLGASQERPDNDEEASLLWRQSIRWWWRGDDSRSEVAFRGVRRRIHAQN